MNLSLIPEVRKLQLLAGKGCCCFCLRELTVKPRGRKRIMCFSADCRSAYDAAAQRQNRADLKVIGASVRKLETLVGARHE